VVADETHSDTTASQSGANETAMRASFAS